MSAAALESGIVEQFAQCPGVAPVIAREFDCLVAHLSNGRNRVRQVLFAFSAHRVKLQADGDFLFPTRVSG